MQNLEQIKMLVLSAELGSFSACARHLGKVQSAVSHGINNLEIDLNVELFDRSSRKPVLTPAGERLYRSAKALLIQSEEFELVAKSINRHEESLLTLVFDDALLTARISQILEQFSQQFPHTQLDIMMRPSPDIIALLVDGVADLGLMFSEVSNSKEVDFSFVGHIPMVPVCPVTHELANKIKITETDLYPFRQVAIRGNHKIEPSMLISMTPNVWWSTSTVYAMSLIQQGIGWGYVPEYLALPALRNGQLKKMDVSFDHITWQAPVDLVWQRGSTVGPGLRWLQDKMKQSFI